MKKKSIVYTSICIIRARKTVPKAVKFRAINSAAGMTR